MASRHCTAPGTARPRAVRDRSAAATDAEGHADRRAPEVEVRQREVDVAAGLVVLQRAEVAQVATDTDAVVDVAVDAAADVDSEIVAGEIVEQPAAVDAAADQADAAGAVGADARAVLAANRRADDDVAHQRR